MRDLYHRLSVAPYSPEEEIRRAVTKTTLEPSLRADAENVLLNPRHRNSYDRAHRLLTAIGSLRTRLDLQLRPFWARSHNQDFTAAAHTGRVNPIAVVQSLQAEKRSKMSRFLRFTIGLVLGALAAWALWTFK